MDDEVVALWERAVATYETEVPYFALMGERIVGHAELQPGERVLDVACGKGATLVPAARQVGDAGSVLGVDIIQAMVDATGQAIVDAGLSNAQAQQMDAEALELPDASFDVVVMAFGFGFVRPEPALLEIARVLRRPGRFITSVPAGGGDNWAFFGELCQKYGLVPKGFAGGSKVPSPPEVAALFEAAGFTLQAPIMDSVSVTFVDAEAWWRWAWSHGQRSYLEELDDEHLDQFKDDAFGALESFTTPEGVPLEQQFLVLRATV